MCAPSAVDDLGEARDIRELREGWSAPGPPYMRSDLRAEVVDRVVARTSTRQVRSAGGADPVVSCTAERDVSRSLPRLLPGPWRSARRRRDRGPVRAGAAQQVAGTGHLGRRRRHRRPSWWCQVEDIDAPATVPPSRQALTSSRAMPRVGTCSRVMLSVGCTSSVLPSVRGRVAGGSSSRCARPPMSRRARSVVPSIGHAGPSRRRPNRWSPPARRRAGRCRRRRPSSPFRGRRLAVVSPPRPTMTSA